MLDHDYLWVQRVKRQLRESHRPQVPFMVIEAAEGKRTSVDRPIPESEILRIRQILIEARDNGE